MYDTWGGTSRILGARGLRKKLSPVEGFRPPTLTRVDPTTTTTLYFGNYLAICSLKDSEKYPSKYTQNVFKKCQEKIGSKMTPPPVWKKVKQIIWICRQRLPLYVDQPRVIGTILIWRWSRSFPDCQTPDMTMLALLFLQLGWDQINQKGCMGLG